MNRGEHAAMRGFFNWLAGIPADTPVSLEVSQARLFAAQFVKRMARQVLVTLTWVRRAATLIMVIAMSVSFQHQQEYLLMLAAGVYAAIAIPVALDCLTFICVKVLATSAVVMIARVVAAIVLIFTVSGSGLLNFLAPGPMVLKWVFVGAMLLVPLAEVVASQIKPDFRKMAAMEAILTPLAESAPAPVAAAPVEPATRPEPAPLVVAETTEKAPESTTVEVEPEPVEDVKPINGYRRRKTPPHATQSSGVKAITATAETDGPRLDAVVEPVMVAFSG
jgi:hypothetical protein